MSTCMAAFRLSWQGIVSAGNPETSVRSFEVRGNLIMRMHLEVKAIILRNVILKTHDAFWF